jgi:ATP synthase protein I
MVKTRPEGQAWRSAWSIGFNFAAAVAGFLFVGYAVDFYYGTGPWGVLIGTFLGLVGGMYNMIRQAIAASREAERESKPPDAGGAGPRR